MLGALRKIIHEEVNPTFDAGQLEDMANGWCLKGDGPSGTTTVESADPWEEQAPYLSGEGDTPFGTPPGVFPEAARIYQNNPLQFYTGQTYANFSPETEAALQMQTGRALGGSPLNQAAQGLNYGTMGGDYLYSNPGLPTFADAAGGGLANQEIDALRSTAGGDYLDASTNPYLAPQAERILADVLPRITSQYAAAGRQNSGMAARAASEGATDALGGLFMENYNRERGNQLAAQQALAGYGESALGRQLQGAGAMADIYGQERGLQQQAMQMAPALSDLDYQDIARLQEVGNVREDLNQQAINEAMQRFQFENRAPWDQLALYQGALQGTYGGSNTQTQTGPRRSVGAGVLGGGAAGAGLGYMGADALGLTGGEGALLGGGLGGLLGAF